jgi:mono/diheme cytochrome c family protein
MKTPLHLPLVAGLALLMLAACDNPKSARGFRLPDGDVIAGKQAFLSLQCNTCHSVEGVDLPAPVEFNIHLGGESPRIKTYGELVTSVINPSHVVSSRYKQEIKEGKLSSMPDFNARMTVRQMIDLVAFLQPRYRLMMPEGPFPYYH